MGIKEYKIVLTVCPEDFQEHMGRKPKSQEEFDEWARLAEKGLVNADIDRGIIYECASDAMREDQDE
jgi:predicted secreted protein